LPITRLDAVLVLHCRVGSQSQRSTTSQLLKSTRQIWWILER